MFKNHQWKVTPVGLISLNKGDGYQIDASRLTEITHRGCIAYDWPVRMAEQSWVDLDAFVEAFQRALIHHGDKLHFTINCKVRAASTKSARSIKMRCGQWPPKLAGISAHLAMPP